MVWPLSEKGENMNKNNDNDNKSPLIKVITKSIVFIIIVILLYFGGKWAYRYAYEVISGASDYSKDVQITIPKGSSSDDIAKILKDNDLTKSTTMFKYKAKKLGFANKFQYGDFTLNTSMNYKEKMIILASEGEKKETITVTIPEGYSISQIAKKLSDEGICTENEFYEALENNVEEFRFIKSIPNRENRFQGYLFPSTYEFFVDATANDVVSKMLNQFNIIFKDEYYERANELGLTVDEIITIASIIEKEVRVDEERAKVAGVIYNRMNQNMNLQMCSTVVYAWELIGQPVERDRLLYEHLDIESPYNTYMYAGLPKGPVANPGEDSIKAALYPEEHDYLYFVLKNPDTGVHEFNTTLEGHNNAKNKYNQEF